MYKLVVCDMDGTLLNSEGVISNRNIKTLKNLIKNDIQVAIATGRIHPSASTFGKQIGIKTPLITCNGAVIKDLDEKEYFKNKVTFRDCLEIFNECKKHDILLQFYTEDICYIEKSTSERNKFIEWCKNLEGEKNVTYKEIDNAYEWLKENKDTNIFKILMNTEDDKLRKNLKNKFKKINSIECLSSWSTNIEIMNKGVSKGQAVKRLAKMLNIKQDEIICFGDNENDLSMIEYAGLGIAMGNANEGVKELADYITISNDEDGISHAVSELMKDVI
ncbi:MAG: HAD family phosphatase [Firmicutes bacterium]|nr:HAD family phosphatase [Bacillota bacterium]